jgi:poly [ADP-ribose] polymerase
MLSFVKNSQAAIHNWFTMELEDVFEVEREGEVEKFAPFVNLKHHRLLFHGSRLANYVGILSQGLRIAPPEAPVTGRSHITFSNLYKGYFLGKGVYFADMASKSAEYCRPSKENPYAYEY